MNSRPISEDDLQAAVDGRLDEAAAAGLAQALENDRAAAARLADYRAQNAALHALFHPVLDEPLPPTLVEMAVAGPSTAKITHRWAHWRLVASVALLIGGGLAGWFAHAWWQPTAIIASLPRQAAIAHVVFSPDVRRPVEIGADHEEQLVTWLSKRLGTPVRPPRLAGLGYELIGGRLLPGNSGPVAQFMYHDASGQRLTLYVTADNPGNRDTAFRFAQEGPVNVFYWIDGRFGYALSAGIPKNELARIATAVYDQLDHP